MSDRLVISLLYGALAAGGIFAIIIFGGF